MFLINNSENALCHGDVKKNFYRLEVGKTLEVPDEIAKIWLGFKGVEVYVTPEQIEKEKAKAVEEALAKAKAEQQAEQKAIEKAIADTKPAKEPAKAKSTKKSKK